MVWMLPASLSDRANQHLFSGVQLWIAGIELMRILGRIVHIHQIWHRTAVNYEVGGVIWFGWDFQAAARSRGASCAGSYPLWVRDLRKRLIVNVGVHLRPLKQVLAVIAGFGVVVGRRRMPVVAFAPVRFCRKVVRLQGRTTIKD